MSRDPQQETTIDLERFLDGIGARVTARRPIDHGVQHTVAHGSDTATVNVYRTGKASTGGKASSLKERLEGWRLSRSGAKAGGGPAATRPVNGSPRPALDGTPRVGIDEAGKGDYFGPLVVAGTRVLGLEDAKKLRETGVRDSKLLGVGEVRAMARRVVEALRPENVCVVALGPREYEERRAAAGNNVNRLLGEVNVEIVERLEAEVELVVVDEFARAARSYIEPRLPRGLRLEVRPRAEDDAAVAAASVLARARYLEELEKLSEMVGFELPRGATHVLGAARRVFEERGAEGLAGAAKTHFATTEKVLGAASGRGGRR